MRETVPRPNIILITPDQLSAHAMGVAGNPVIQTPNLDQLATDGVRYTECHVHNWVCTPSRATLVTGAHPSSHRVLFNEMDADTRLATVAGLLSEDGYRTGHVGKWHLFPEGESFGFQERIGHSGYPEYLTSVGIDPTLASEHGSDWTRNFGTWVSPIPEEHYITTWETARAIDFVERGEGEPFFLWLSYEKPHPPFNPPAGWAEMYDPATIPLPETWDDNTESAVEAKRDDSVSHWRTGIGPAAMTDDEIRQTIAYYYASISHVDENIGRLRARLSELGIDDNTIIIVSSDHGEMLGEHRLLNKGPYPFDQLTRVPAIISDPRRAGRVVVDTPVGQESILTTILAAAEVPPAPTMRGVDLLDLAAAHADGVSGLHYGPHYDVVIRTWRTATLRYTMYGAADGSIIEELFDIVADPLATRDISAEPDRATELQQMRFELLRDIVRRDRDRPELLAISERFRDQHAQKGKI